jgi:hypothetical protein
MLRFALKHLWTGRADGRFEFSDPLPLEGWFGPLRTVVAQLLREQPPELV